MCPGAILAVLFSLIIVHSFSVENLQLSTDFVNRTNNESYTKILAIRQKLFADLPDLLSTARVALQEQIKLKTKEKVDTDKLYLVYGPPPIGSKNPNALLNYHQSNFAKWSVTLSSAVLIQFPLLLKDVKYNINTRYAILYSNGSSFGEKLRPSDLREILQKVDFKSKINKQLEAFWAKHKDSWRTLVKAEFLTAALEARDKGHLSQLDFEHLLSGVAPALSKDKGRPATLEDFERYESSSEIEVTYLRYLYMSYNILRIKLQNGKIILYIPSVTRQAFYPFANNYQTLEDWQIFYVFNNDLQLMEWLKNLANNQERRFILARHFEGYDQVNKQLKLLAEGYNSLTEEPSFPSKTGFSLSIPYAPPADTDSKTNFVLRGDIFNWVAWNTKVYSLKFYEKQDYIIYKTPEKSQLFYYETIIRSAGPLLPIWESIGGSHAIAKLVGNLHFGKDYLWIPLRDTAKRRLPSNNGVDTFHQRISKLFNGSVSKTSGIIAPCKAPQTEQVRLEQKSFYQELKRRFPDLELQLLRPDLLLVNHDKRAIDDANRYVGKEDNLVQYLIRSNHRYLFKEGYINTKFLERDDHEHDYCFNGLRKNVSEAYKRSPTFRRLFNYAYDNELKDIDNRLGILLLDPSQTPATGERVVEGVRIIDLYADMRAIMNKTYYQSGPCLVHYSVERLYLREVVKALTGLRDVSDGSSRGPIVEYTNIILKEMNLAVPVRTQFDNSLPDVEAVKRRGVNCINLAFFLHLRNGVTSDFPDLTQMARQLMQVTIKERIGVEVNPDQVYLNYFGDEKRNHQPTWSTTLTGLAFSNFPTFSLWADTDRDYGVYRFGPGCESYDNTEKLDNLLPSQLKVIVWQLNFYQHVKNKLNAFWSAHRDNWRASAKAEFIRSAIWAVNRGFLSKDDCTCLLNGVAGAYAIIEVNDEFFLNEPITMAHLYKNQTPLIDVRHLEINNLIATDIFVFTLKDKREIIYMPDSPQRFYTFEDSRIKRNWVFNQSIDLKKRMLLALHFSVGDRQNGFFSKGIVATLLEIAEGDESLPVSYGTKITSDLFDELALQTKNRGYSDADKIITDDGELFEQFILGELQLVSMILAIPLMLAGPIGIATDLALLGSTLGLEIDLAVNGDTEKERREMAVWAEVDIIMSLPAIFGAVFEGTGFFKKKIKGFSRTPQYLPTEVSYKTQELPAVKRLERVNGKLGYPLSPTKPPKLPRLQEEVPDTVLSGSTLNVELPGTTTADPAKVSESKVTLVEGSLKRTFQQPKENLPGPSVVQPEIPDFASGNKASHYYDQLYQTAPELKDLLQSKPCPALIENDLKANDLTNRYKGREADIITTFIKEKEQSYFGGKIKGYPMHYKMFPKEYYALEYLVKNVYGESPTFRRLFNYACDKSLKYKENRWLIAPEEHFRTTVTPEDLKDAFGGERAIGMNLEVPRRLLYQGINDLVYYTERHATLNEVIKALLIDYHSEDLLGTLNELVVNYVNIVLREMKDDVPLRARYDYSLSEHQKSALDSYKRLAEKYKSLGIQLKHPDELLLAHDHIAFDDGDYLDVFEGSPARFMLKETTGAQTPELITNTEEFKFLEPLLLNAYKKSPTFRRLYNFASDYVKHSYELVPNSDFFCCYFGFNFREMRFVPSKNPKLGLNFDENKLGYYLDENQDKYYRFSFESAYIHEVVHALTELPDLTMTEKYPRGPVVEYTNIILYEMGYDYPLRVDYYLTKTPEELNLSEGDRPSSVERTQ
jgi:hypothetical protein